MLSLCKKKSRSCKHFTVLLFHFIVAEDERLELPQGCPRRFSRPLQYHYANPPNDIPFSQKIGIQNYEV